MANVLQQTRMHTLGGSQRSCCRPATAAQLQQHHGLRLHTLNAIRHQPWRSARQHGVYAVSTGDRESSRVTAPWNLTFDLRERETEWTEANQVPVVGCGMAPAACGVLNPYFPDMTMAQVTAQRVHLEHSIYSACQLASLSTSSPPLRHPVHTPLPCCLTLQARLVALTAAQELAMPFADMEARLDTLAALLPDIGGRLASLRCATLSRPIPTLSLSVVSSHPAPIPFRPNLPTLPLPQAQAGGSPHQGPGPAARWGGGGRWGGVAGPQ